MIDERRTDNDITQYDSHDKHVTKTATTSQWLLGYYFGIWAIRCSEQPPHEPVKKPMAHSTKKGQMQMTNLAELQTKR